MMNLMGRIVRREASLLRSLTINLLVFVFIMSNIVEAWGARWKYYGANENGWYFYETESMTRSVRERRCGGGAIRLYGKRRVSLGERGRERISEFGL